MSPLPARIALIFGGVSPEHEISILSAAQVAGALEELRRRGPESVEIDAIYINREGQWVWRGSICGALEEGLIDTAPKWDCQPAMYQVEVMHFAAGLSALNARRIDCALLVLHGANGEDGRLQGALDLAGIAYTGSGAAASALCMNKPRCQAVLNAARLPIAPSLAVLESQPVAPEKILEVVGLPCVVKPATGGSSVGMSIVREAQELTEALEAAFVVDAEVMVEQFVRGREFTCGVLERPAGQDLLDTLALPVVEIVPPEGRFFDYEAKYFDGATRELVPAPIPDNVTRRLQDLAIRAHQACGCRGFSRVDFICDVAAGAEPTILELNTLPGMTARSLLPQAAQAAGIDYPSLVGLMLETAGRD